MEKEVGRTCVKCNTDKPAKEYYADNKTGWSKYCASCRKKRQQKVLKQRIRKYHKIQEQATEELTKLKAKQLSLKIKQLQKEFNRFTLINRNRLQVLLRRCEGREELLDRTRKAIDSRTLNQERASALLAYQIDIVAAGLRPQHISLLWRDKYGNDLGSERQEQD